METVVGLFEQYSEADRAVQALHEFGVDNADISVITREKEFDHRTNAAVPGAATGAVAGGLVGLIAGVSAFLVPGIGPVIATGALASTLASTLGMTAVGAGVGAATGGLLGALVDSGFSHTEAEYYTEGVKRGGILVSVNTDSQHEEEVKEILLGAGAKNMDTRYETWQNEERVRFEEEERSDQEAHRH